MAEATEKTEAETTEAQKCTVEGCKRPYRAKGYCVTHYKLWRRGELEGHKAPLQDLQQGSLQEAGRPLRPVRRAPWRRAPRQPPLPPQTRGSDLRC